MSKDFPFKIMQNGFYVDGYTASCGHNVNLIVFDPMRSGLQMALNILEAHPCEPCRAEREVLLKQFEEKHD